MDRDIIISNLELNEMFLRIKIIITTYIVGLSPFTASFVLRFMTTQGHICSYYTYDKLTSKDMVC